MSALRVVAPGLLTTVQDLGRPGHAADGISASGAADPLALRIGNRLVGNRESVAALEMTLLGGSFLFESDALIALTGADAKATIGDRTIPAWRSTRMRAGELLTCAALRNGSRAYLCVRGGIAVPMVFGSASTHLLTGLGGTSGRALRAGDRLPLGAIENGAPTEREVDPSALPGYRRGQPFRATEGPQASWFPEGARALFYDTAWRVDPASDRMGIRLEGPVIPTATPRELLTEGVPLGAIQIPPGGRPIVLFVEHQTTGGYPKIANVIAADLARLGGLSPHEAIRFEAASFAEARRLLRAQEEALDALFV